MEKITQAEVQEVKQFCEKVKDNVEKVIIGKSKVIDQVLVALLCAGHVLTEDVPGTGKTMLARSLAISLGLEFNRIQFTPDLLPSDVTGVSVFNQKTSEFEFKEGPIFAQIVLADEINRATPRTQSALLECMEEKQVTTDGKTRKLPKPFLVIATQNPVEYEGTFPLPEAQLDRFLMKISLGYPTETKKRILVRLQYTIRWKPSSPLQMKQLGTHAGTGEKDVRRGISAGVYRSFSSRNQKSQRRLHRRIA